MSHGTDYAAERRARRPAPAFLSSPKRYGDKMHLAWWDDLRYRRERHRESLADILVKVGRTLGAGTLGALLSLLLAIGALCLGWYGAAASCALSGASLLFLCATLARLVRQIPPPPPIEVTR